MNVINVLTVAFTVGCIVLFATSIFQWLWNITMPKVFGLRQISFWIAFRLLLVAGFLTSGGFIHYNAR